MAPTPPAFASAPSAQLVALALAIVKSKPTGTAARDHVLQLRNHLKHERQDSSAAAETRYLNHITYWQERCRKTERKCDELQGRIVSLERANQPGNVVHVDADPPPSVGKRKRNNSSTKRPRRAKMQQPNIPSAEQTQDDDFDLLEHFGEDGVHLIECIWKFRIQLRRPEADPQAVCSSVMAIANAIGRVLDTIARSHDRFAAHGRSRPSSPDLQQDKTEFACAIAACARAFTMVLCGIKVLNDDSPGKRLPQLVIYECVKMFSTALGVIESSARQAAAQKGSQRSTSDDVKESVVARGVAHLLRSIINCLDKDDVLHRQLFDGFAYVLFERVGRRLYYCTFGRHRGATIEGDITLSLTPTDPEEIAHLETEALAIKYEVKALILVLERAMGLAPNHMNPKTAKKGTVRPERALSMRNVAVPRTRLSSLAKDRLQRTLITCMFGDQNEDEFLDVITMPVHLGPLPKLPKIDDKDVNEWYQGQVWRLIGWDVLGRENE